MNIAFLTPEYVSESSSFDGGLANYLFRVAQCMIHRGHKVEIFTRSHINETISHYGVTVHRVKINGYFLSFIDLLTLRRFKRSIHILSLSFSLRKKLLERHNKEKFDIIQTSSFMSCGLFLTFFRPAAILSRVSSYEPLWRKFYLQRLTLDQRLLEWLEKLTLKRSNGVYSPSELLSRNLEKKMNLKVEVLRPPLFKYTIKFNDKIFAENLSDKKYFLFFGTIGILKGGEVLAQVLPKILAQYPKMFFVFAGKDAFSLRGFSMFQNIIQQAGIYKKQIINFGVLRHSQLFPIIEHSQAVVLPSLIDNLPNTMLEAMSLGKIVIGTLGTSFDEIIEDGKSGIIVKPNNPLDLYRAMERVWNMSEIELGNIGNAALKRVNKVLSPEITCKKLEQYFQEFF